MNTSTIGIILSVILALTLINSFVVFSIAGTLQEHPTPQKSITGNVVAEQKRTILPITDDPSKGSPKAPVMIIEFSDFQCPFCARFKTQTLSQIEEKYIKTGKVAFVYKDFPLEFHENAMKAAEAAACAHEQGNFWEYHDLLFAYQQQMGDASLKQYAKELSLDTKKFVSCLDSGKMRVEIQQDMQEGAAAGVRGTPAFFVNGVFISGAQPFDEFQKVIEKELLS